MAIAGSYCAARSCASALPRRALRARSADAARDHLVVLLDRLVEPAERDEGLRGVIPRGESRVVRRIRVGGGLELRQRRFELGLLRRIGAGQLAADRRSDRWSCPAAAPAA